MGYQGYLDWVERVWHAVGALWTQTDGRKRDMGFTSEDILEYLGVDTSIPYWHEVNKGVSGALDQLEGLALLRRVRREHPPHSVIPKLAEQHIGKPVKLLWSRIPQPQLSNDEAEFLLKLIEMSVEEGPEGTYYKLPEHAHTAGQVFEALGRPWNLEVYASMLNMDQTLRIKGLLDPEGHRMTSDVVCKPTYKAFVWAARN